MFESQISAAKVQQNFTTVDAFVTKKKSKTSIIQHFFSPVGMNLLFKVLLTSERTPKFVASTSSASKA